MVVLATFETESRYRRVMKQRRARKAMIYTLSLLVLAALFA